MYLLRMEKDTVIHIQGKSLSLNWPQAREFPQILYPGGCLLVILLEAGIPLPVGMRNITILGLQYLSKSLLFLPWKPSGKSKMSS